MMYGDAKKIIVDVVQRFFSGASVGWSAQSRATVPLRPFVRLTAGNLKRNRFPASSVIDGVVVNTYANKFPVTIDLFTNGRPVPESEQRENTAVEDLTAFVDYLNSDFVTDLCAEQNISMDLDPPDVLDLTAAVYDANYLFRSQVSIMVHFLSSAVGHTGSFGEETIKRVQIVEPDPDTGEEIVVEEKPTIDLSEPFHPSASGGNSQELARETDCGYFTSVNIEDRSEKA